MQYAAIYNKTHLAWSGRDDTQITKIHGDSLVSFWPRWVVSPRKSAGFSMQEKSPKQNTSKSRTLFSGKGLIIFNPNAQNAYECTTFF